MTERVPRTGSPQAISLQKIFAHSTHFASATPRHAIAVGRRTSCCVHRKLAADQKLTRRSTALRYILEVLNAPPMQGLHSRHREGTTAQPCARSRASPCLQHREYIQCIMLIACPSRGTGLPRIAASIFLTCAALQHVHAAQTTLRWDYQASGAGGIFFLHCGQSSGSYTTHVDVGNTDTYTLTGLLEDRTYYCAVTAYDSREEWKAATPTRSAFIHRKKNIDAPAANFTMYLTSGVSAAHCHVRQRGPRATLSAWSWSFGDNTTSTAENPHEVYTTARNLHTLRLTATGDGRQPQKPRR